MPVVKEKFSVSAPMKNEFICPGSCPSEYYCLSALRLMTKTKIHSQKV